MPSCTVKLNKAQVEEVLRRAGWSETLIPIMTAVAWFESSFCVDNFKTDSIENSFGLFQINRNAHPQYSRELLLSDPVYNAKAALDIYKKQGLDAWRNTVAKLRRNGFTIPDIAEITGGGGSSGGLFSNPVSGLTDWFSAPFRPSVESRFAPYYRQKYVEPKTRYNIVIILVILILIFVFQEV